MNDQRADVEEKKEGGYAPCASPDNPYTLPGPQVEPEAAYWTFDGNGVVNTIPQVIQVADLQKLTDDRNSQFYVPAFSVARKELEADIQELAQLAKWRNSKSDFDTPIEGRPRLPLSRFLQMRPPPLGAIFNTDRAQGRISNVRTQCDPANASDVVETGGELARMFESETPGIAHRHALNCLLFRTDISPVRHARVWMALDVAIYSALIASWHYKWSEPRTRYRLRPFEYDCGQSFQVLYDRAVDEDGNDIQSDEPERGCPQPSPGTPRHPAYPSGHSTYSAAASEVLKYFFPSKIGPLMVHDELDNLADNIGYARLWGGVHWLSDHVAGQRIGRAVAKMVADQLRGDRVSKLPSLVPCCDQSPNKDRPPLSADEYRRLAVAVRTDRTPDPAQDRLPPPNPACADRALSPNAGAI